MKENYSKEEVKAILYEVFETFEIVNNDRFLHLYVNDVEDDVLDLSERVEWAVESFMY